MLHARLGPAVLAALLLAGCVTPAGVAPVDAGSSAEDAAAVPAFELSGRECVFAGFVAAYSRGENGYPDTLAEVWKLADIREEVGNPVRDTVGNPVDGPLMGNWHMGFRCASVATSAGDAEDFLFGLVGEMVEPPAWDVGGADAHFLLSGFSFANGTIGDAARASTIADLTHTASVRVDWLTPKELPRSTAYVELLDAEKGLYESTSTLGLYREVEARTIRLWWQVPTDGVRAGHAHAHDSGGSLTSFGAEVPSEGEWHPVFWDLALSGGPQYVTPREDGLEIAAHNKMSFEHGPIVYLPCITNVYENADLALSPARVVDDVTLTLLWTH